MCRKEDGTIVVNELEFAASFWKRFWGLMGRSGLKENTGLLIYPCNMVHMLFMRFPIDVVFCSAEKEILHIEHGLGPWRVSKKVSGAYYVLELSAGSVTEHRLAVGDTLCFSES